MGMAVRVVGPDPDEAHLRADGPQERRIGGSRAVVGNGERLGREPSRVPQETGLGLELHVPGHQQAPVLPGDPQDQ